MVLILAGIALSDLLAMERRDIYLKLLQTRFTEREQVKKLAETPARKKFLNK